MLKWQLTKTQQIILLVTLSLIFRVALAYWNRDSVAADLSWWLTWAETIEAGESCTSGYVFPYPPLWTMVIGLAQNLSQATGLAFTISIKLPIIIADVLLAASIFLVTGSAALGLAYALNPIAILISGSLAHFDSMLLLPFLWSVALLERKRYTSAGLLAGVSVALKWHPLFFVGLLALHMWFQTTIPRRRIVQYLGGCFLVWLGITLPFALICDPGYLTNPLSFAASDTVTDLGTMRLLKDIGAPIHGLGNAELPGMWGWLISRGKLLLGAKLLLSVVSLAALWRYWFATSKDYLIFFLIAFYTLIGGAAMQYTLWIVPLALYAKRKDVLLFSVVGALASASFMLFKYPTLLVPDLEPRLPFWVSTAAWTNGLFVFFTLGWFAWSVYQLERCRKKNLPYPCATDAFNDPEKPHAESA